ncbi:MAG: single-stranded DNA-binding protein [Spirochaetia bacterium]|nr:single-stranded DNA-binding protein [Spirochaetia bacterium]
MASKKTLISARGVAEPYCYLQKPDYGQGDFKNERGVYKVALTISNDDPRCQAMIDEIVACHEADYAARLEEYEANPPKVVKGKKPLKPYVGDMPFMDNEDGTTTFTFKSYGSFQDKKTGETIKRILPVVDGRGKRLPACPAISGGSEMKLKYTLFPYGWSAVAGASVKLQLDSVMLLKLVEFGAGGDDDWGDETEDDAEDFSGRDFKQQSRSEDSGDSDDSEDSDESEDEGDDGDF